MGTKDETYRLECIGCGKHHHHLYRNYRYHRANHGDGYYRCASCAAVARHNKTEKENRR